MDLCCHMLAYDSFTVLPLRLPLQEVGRLLDGASGWAVVEACMAQMHGLGSVHVHVARLVRERCLPALLVLDGFDEAPGPQRLGSRAWRVEGTPARPLEAPVLRLRPVSCLEHVRGLLARLDRIW